MSFDPVTRLNVFYHREANEKLLVGRLVYEDRTIAFQYAPEFRATGLELSPIKMALSDRVMVARPEVFNGLFGLFDDSLPDGWGCTLLDRYIRSIGGKPGELTPLDRLAWVGSRAIGTLSYEPEHSLETDEVVDLHTLSQQAQEVVEDKTPAALETLLRAGGSPQGARPKALVLLAADGRRVIVGAEHREGFAPYLVKFSARTDSRNAAGAIELAYSVMARKAGVDMTTTKLLAAKGKHRGYFAIQRFDRRGGQRVHTHTVAGLIEAQPGHTFLGYDAVLKITRGLTRDARQVKQMFRRAAFNVYAHNRDDHTRNFAFLMEADGTWKLAPAYDLTFSAGPGGHHTTDIVGEGNDPGAEHLLRLARETGIKSSDAKAIVDQVRDVCSQWTEHAKDAGVPAAERKRIWTELSVKK